MAKLEKDYLAWLVVSRPFSNQSLLFAIISMFMYYLGDIKPGIIFILGENSLGFENCKKRNTKVYQAISISISKSSFEKRNIFTEIMLWQVTAYGHMIYISP